MKIALVQFKEVGKKYYFSIPSYLNVQVNDYVVVETVVGVEIGYVYNIKEEKDVELIKTLKPILRVATDEDISINEANQSLEQDIVLTTKSLVKELDLEMIVLSAEYTLDQRKLTICFKADGRVDFRELVRELSSIYHTRIELRQIGPRDVAKLVGGLGPCGRILCCETFIGEFDAVTIRMAKNQELSLNPKNISGICGKLLCCLKYEDEIYDELRQMMPDLNDYVKTEKGRGRVLELNLISGKLKLEYRIENEQMIEWINFEDVID